MNPLEAVGALTLLLSTAAKGGTVDQLRINSERGPDGWSWRREVLTAASYTSWAVYGLMLGNTVVALSGLLGAGLSGLLLWQATRPINTATGDPS